MLVVLIVYQAIEPWRSRGVLGLTVSLCCVLHPVAIISDLTLLDSLPTPEVGDSQLSVTAQTDSRAQLTLAPPWLDYHTHTSNHHTHTPHHNTHTSHQHILTHPITIPTHPITFTYPITTHVVMACVGVVMGCVGVWML